MKIEFSYPIYDYEGGRLAFYQYKITIEDEFDVEYIYKMIKAGDFILVYGKPIFWAIITNTKLIDGPEKMIEIEGNIEGIKATTFTIGKNDTIDLDFEPEVDVRLEKLEKLKENLVKFEMYKKAISTEHIQNEGFRILQKYINTKPSQVVYGNNVISSMDNELVKVVFVSWNFIKNQDLKMIKLLTQESHKYNKTNIVVVWKGNENYQELKNYGGIVGVLY